YSHSVSALSDRWRRARHHWDGSPRASSLVASFRFRVEHWLRGQLLCSMTSWPQPMRCRAPGHRVAVAIERPREPGRWVVSRGQQLHRRIVNQHSVTPERPATRAPVFFWITVGLLAMLLFGRAAAALLLVVFAAENINRSGGWGWLLVGSIYVVAIILVCFACALSTAVSLFRREPHRRLSIVILIISCLIVSASGPNLIRA